jgi:hypothetical protein
MVPDHRNEDNESLNPEVLRGIEREFDRTANQTGRFVAAFLAYLTRALVVLLILIGIAFFLDYRKLHNSQNAYGSVEIHRYYAVGLKNKKTDYSSGDSEIQTCVNSVFPHSGYYPCWYLRRHNVKEIDI